MFRENEMHREQQARDNTMYNGMHNYWGSGDGATSAYGRLPGTMEASRLHNPSVTPSCTTKDIRMDANTAVPRPHTDNRKISHTTTVEMEHRFDVDAGRMTGDLGYHHGYQPQQMPYYNPYMASNYPYPPPQWPSSTATHPMMPPLQPYYYPGGMPSGPYGGYPPTSSMGYSPYTAPPMHRGAMDSTYMYPPLPTYPFNNSLSDGTTTADGTPASNNSDSSKSLKRKRGEEEGDHHSNSRSTVEPEVQPLRKLKCSRPGCPYTTDRHNLFKSHGRYHQAMKSGKKKFYVCLESDCGYIASDSSNLRVHMRKHTGFKPFHCTVEGCDYASTQKNNVKLHIQRNHPSVHVGDILPREDGNDPIGELGATGDHDEEDTPEEMLQGAVNDLLRMRSDDEEESINNDDRPEDGKEATNVNI